MATIANLAVGITANPKGFIGGLGRAGASLKGFVTSVGAAGARVAAFGTAMGTAAAAGATYMVKKQMDAIDAIAKTSDRLGIGTERLVAYQHAAGLAGVSGEQLVKALQKMQVNIGETVGGTGEAADAFRRLGLDAQSLADMSPDAAFEAIVERFGGLKNATDKASVAYDIFGRSGQELITVLNMGREGLDAAAAETQRFGLSLSRVDAAKVEAANDSVFRLKQLFTGAARTAAVELAPFIQAATARVIEFGTSGQGASRLVVSGIEAVASGVAHTIDAVRYLRAGLELVKLGAVGMARLAIEWLGKLQDLILDNIYRPLLNLAKFVASFPVPGADKIRAAAMIGEALITSGQGARDTWVTTLKDIEKGLVANVDALAKAPSAAGKVKAFFDGIRESAQAAAEATAAAAQNSGKSMIADLDAFNDRLAAMRKAAQEPIDFVNDLRKSIRDLGKTAEQARLDELIGKGAFGGGIQGIMRINQARSLLAQLEMRQKAGQKPQQLSALSNPFSDTQAFQGAVTGAFARLQISDVQGARDVNQQMLDELQEQNKKLADMIRAVGKISSLT